MLEILYQDEHIVAVNKPPGLLVHRTAMAADVKKFAVQELRNQIDQHVYPAHRLDRKTSGVLLFALNEEALSLLMSDFAEGKMQKRYLAIVRGYAPDEDTIDYPLRDESGKLKEAVTKYRTLDLCELEVPFGKHQTSRYSLVEAFPQTGRMHQLRKHFAHILHPIIGDRPHGCNKQNKLFLERWNMKEMMLHAQALTLTHPISKASIKIEARTHKVFNRMSEMMNFSEIEF